MKLCLPRRELLMCSMPGHSHGECSTTELRTRQLHLRGERCQHAQHRRALVLMVQGSDFQRRAMKVSGTNPQITFMLLLGFLLHVDSAVRKHAN